MGKFLSIISTAVFLWTFWFASCLGVYVGTFTAKADGQGQCRYMTARGFFDEAKTAAVKRSTNAQWCPATWVFLRDKESPHKPVDVLTGIWNHGS